jgi:sugar O-acyltransferase (sialic acid O-acetyltransferase NeuD family)
MDILIFGAGGHGQVVADILLRCQAAGRPEAPIGFIDDDPSLLGASFLGMEVMGGSDFLDRIPHDAVVIAIGENDTRKEIYQRLRRRGHRFAIACHPSAVLGSDAKVGDGSMICAGVIVNPGTEIGENVILNTGCILDHHNRVGPHVHIAPGVTMGGKVIIEEGALIGIGATVMPRCKVGAWSVVAAGAVVCEEIPERVLALGVPAKVVKAL